MWPTKGGSVLVLSRKVNQQIVIGQDIFLTVISIGGNQVRLGVEAPRHIPVHRQEIAPRRPQPATQLTLPFQEEPGGPEEGS